MESTVFERCRSGYLSDEEFRSLQLELLANPRSGPVIPGTGGLRKLRWGARGRGKRGGIRIIYYFLEERDRFYLLTLYAKTEVSDLTAAQRKQLRQFMEAWKDEQA